MIGLPNTNHLVALLTRAVTALERMADAAEDANRQATIARLGQTSRERIAADAARAGLPRGVVDGTRGWCPTEPVDTDLEGGQR